MQRLKYHNDQPKTFPVNYYNHFKATDSIKIPDYYVLSSAWDQVIERLKRNGVKMQKIQNDTNIEVETYQIQDYSTYNSAFEGHYPHYDTKVKLTTETINFKKGDVLISTQQSARRYILETLEPEMRDSFFNWNFFDSILQQKEGFSAYVFEDYASEFLSKNKDVNEEFQLIKNNDSLFRKSPYMQLQWIFKQSPLYEKAHLRYPVFRVFN
jgi:hypothetical protein